jgi:hypothetical protein
LTAVSDPVQLWFLWRPRLIDPADEMVLEAQAFGILTVTPPEACKEVQDRYEKK